MNLFNLWCGLSMAGLMGVATATAAPTQPSAADLTRAPAISDVSIAPDGKHLVALTSPDGKGVYISVWRTDALAAKPVIIASTRMRLLNVQFLKNDRLLFTAVQNWDDSPPKGHLIKSYVTDLEGKSFDQLLPDRIPGQSEDATNFNKLVNARLISTLPNDPRRVLVEDSRFGGDGDLYLVDVYTMSAGKFMQGSDRYSYFVDTKGVVRGREELNFDHGKVYVAVQIRDPQTGDWQEHFRSYAKDRSPTQIVGFTDDPNIIYISASNNADKVGVYEYDIKQRKILEPAFEHKLFDAQNLVYSQSDGGGDLLGFTYDAETPKIYWVDGRMESIFKALSQSLGASPATIDWVDPATGQKTPISVDQDFGVRYRGASNDGKYILVEKSGPKQPPQYYLLTDGTKLIALGKSRPWIDPTALGDTRMVQYPARDGLMIPAFLTTPPKQVFGPGPYPTLIEPHGGPWARDEMDWDPTGWTQYFAARGYAVLRPQFRGSEGWGQKLWRAGDGEWGQKMQDDNDDGVKWLIDQHIADPARVAIFGYSYGGYAALAAAIRPNGLYQCAIAGAGAGDLEKIAYQTKDQRWQREFQNPTIGGLDPLKHATEAKIPVMLYHGDRDRTVEVEESRKFAAALKSAGKPVRYVEIKDMGHQMIFWTPAMAEQQLAEVDSFLKSDCKPGGL